MGLSDRMVTSYNNKDVYGHCTARKEFIGEQYSESKNAQRVISPYTQ
jgi:hypothetical protein